MNSSLLTMQRITAAIGVEIGGIDLRQPLTDLDIRMLSDAVATHHGSFEDLDQTFGALGAAVAERAIGVRGAIRENYLVGAFDTPDAQRHRTEVCWPVFQVSPGVHERP